MTKKGNANKANYVKILMSASKMYGNDSGSGFKLFDSAAYGGKDLLFKDSTIELEDVSSQTYSQFLGQAYLDDLEALDDCVTPTAGSVKSTPHFVGSFVFSLVALMLFI